MSGEHLPAGMYSKRPDLERLLVESRESPAEWQGPLDRWRLVHRRLENVLYQLRVADKIFAEDPHLTAELPPGIGGRTRWQAATDSLEGIVQELAGLLPCSTGAAVRTSICAAIVPQRGQQAPQWAQQAATRAELAQRAAAVLWGEPWEMYLVPGCEALTAEAIGIAGVPNPGSVANSDPQRYFYRKGQPSSFDRTQYLHWVTVLWNTARVPPTAADYPTAQATKREAVATLAYLERADGPSPFASLTGETHP